MTMALTSVWSMTASIASSRPAPSNTAEGAYSARAVNGGSVTSLVISSSMGMTPSWYPAAL